jgi:hypothetical protein
MNHRLHSLCPYFAMFPPEFVRENMLAHTKRGETVFDGFSGRGTTLLEALLNDRCAIACDVNPVAFCVTAAKAHLPSLPTILNAIYSLEVRYREGSKMPIELQRLALPQFFRRAFYAETLRQILFLRSHLNWRGNLTHRFLCALTLGHLHGEMNRSEHYLSNQMPHSISTKPVYSLEYWREKNLWPPHRNAFVLLRDRAEFRLAGGFPPRTGLVRRCDVRISGSEFQRYTGKVAAVITSPPYLDMTSFEEDQWLRLWFMGGPPRPTYGIVSKDDRHTSLDRYWDFLAEGWKGMASLLRPRATIVCRIGAKSLDPEEISKKVTQSLKKTWKNIQLIAEPVCTALPNSQAKLLHPRSIGCRFEIDLCYALPSR